MGHVSHYFKHLFYINENSYCICEHRLGEKQTGEGLFSHILGSDVVLINIDSVIYNCKFTRALKDNAFWLDCHNYYYDYCILLTYKHIAIISLLKTY